MKIKVRLKRSYTAEQWRRGKTVDGVLTDPEEVRKLGQVLSYGVAVAFFNNPGYFGIVENVLSSMHSKYMLVEDGDWILTDENGYRSLWKTDDFERGFEQA